jgi:hypothetical protein
MSLLTKTVMKEYGEAREAILDFLKGINTWLVDVKLVDCSKQPEKLLEYINGFARNLSEIRCWIEKNTKVSTPVDKCLRVQIKEGWEGAGRVGTQIGNPWHDKRSGTVWFPVQWDGEEDPDWQKGPSITYKPDEDKK